MNPIDFMKFTLKEKEQDKYLGQMIKSNIAESALGQNREDQRCSYRNQINC